MKVRQFEKGEVIFREGALGSSMYEIRRGRVGIYAGYGTREERLLTELEEGRIFGEMAVIEVYTRSATAVVLSAVEAEEISAEDLQAYFMSRPEKLMEIMRGLSRRLRELTQDYEQVRATIREWKDVSDRGEEKGAGLLAAIRRFADIFAEGLSAMSSPIAGGYYYTEL